MLRRRARLAELLIILSCGGGVLVTQAAAENSGDGDDSFCVDACRSSLAPLRFSDVEVERLLATQECTSRLHIQSLYLCAGAYCSSEDMVLEGLQALNRTCKENDGSSIPSYEDVVSGFTEEDIAGLERINASSRTIPPADGEEPHEEPVLPTEGYFELWKKTLSTYAYVKYHHMAYAWLMGYFWAAVSLFGVGNRMLWLFESRVRGSFKRQPSSWVWLKRNLLTPASFRQRCAQDVAGWGTVPPRVQSLTIGVFLLLNVVGSIHGYKIFPGMLYWPDETKQVLRYVSDRTGIIAFANFPIIWLFGMRNNVVLWLTGWDFGTFNNFHRWVARIATLQAVVHSVGYTILIWRDGGWTYFAWWLARLFFWTGELATIFMVAVIVFSVFWLRRTQYELFLVVHIILSMLLLLTMLGHVSIFHGEWDALVWVPVLIWVFDRVLRSARIIWFNPRFWSTRAEITYNESADMVRLSIPRTWRWYPVRPGTFYFLSGLDQANFWESHPFTVAGVPEKSSTQLSTLNDASPLLRPTSPSQDIGNNRRWGRDEMTFLIRPYDSFTLRLKELAETCGPKAATVRVAVDGPYGNTLPLETFDHVVFVVGGSGVVVPLSYMKKLIAAMKGPRSIRVYWTVRQASMARDVLANELDEAAQSEQVELHVYITGDGRDVSRPEDIPHSVIWRYGRMDTTSVIGSVVDTVEEGSLAVVGCGPARMADDCRRVATEHTGSSRLRVEYFEESFQW